MTAPKGATYRKEWHDLSAEEIYRRLDARSRRSRGGLDGHLASSEPEEKAEDPEGSEQGEGAQEGAEAQQGAEPGEGAQPQEGAGTSQGQQGSEPGEGTQPPEGAGTDPQGSEQGGDAQQGAEQEWKQAQDPPPWSGPLPECVDFDRPAWKRRVIAAATAARLRGTLPAAMVRPLEHLLEPVCPWQEILAQFVHALFRNDYRFLPPNRRFLASGIYLPSVRGEHIDLVVAIDTSGSISGEILRRFGSEMRGILLSVPSYTVHLLACDAAIAVEQTFESEEPFEIPELKGGGGTDFRPVFERVASEGWDVDLLVYMTDAQGRFPDKPPEYDVLWLLSESGEVPFGHKLLMEDAYGNS
jgi:hypothetical protein